MSPREEESSKKPHARRMYASELKRLRDEAGWSQSKLAELSTLDRTHISRLESGERLGELRNAEILDEVYGTGRHLQNLWTLAREDAYRDRYKRYMQLADEARIMRIYSASTIPALLQTEEYAREQLGTDIRQDEPQLAEDVAIRLGRQDALFRDNPLHLRAVLDESALRRKLKDPEAWVRQLEHLIEIARRPNVTLQVLLFDAGLQYLLGGTLTLLTMPDGKPVAYEESNTSGDLIEDAAEVESLSLAYDQLRDMALSPQDSLAFIRNLMEKSKTCDPPDDQT
jgi:transcriptional regulator with XRE-family HTH domain